MPQRAPPSVPFLLGRITSRLHLVESVCVFTSVQRVEDGISAAKKSREADLRTLKHSQRQYAVPHQPFSRSDTPLSSRFLEDGTTLCAAWLRSLLPWHLNLVDGWVGGHHQPLNVAGASDRDGHGSNYSISSHLPRGGSGMPGDDGPDPDLSMRSLDLDGSEVGLPDGLSPVSTRGSVRSWVPPPASMALHDRRHDPPVAVTMRAQHPYGSRGVNPPQAPVHAYSRAPNQQPLRHERPDNGEGAGGTATHPPPRANEQQWGRQSPRAPGHHPSAWPPGAQAHVADKAWSSAVNGVDPRQEFGGRPADPAGFVAKRDVVGQPAPVPLPQGRPAAPVVELTLEALAAPSTLMPTPQHTPTGTRRNSFSSAVMGGVGDGEGEVTSSGLAAVWDARFQGVPRTAEVAAASTGLGTCPVRLLGGHGLSFGIPTKRADAAFRFVQCPSLRRPGCHKSTPQAHANTTVSTVCRGIAATSFPLQISETRPTTLKCQCS